MKKSNVVIFILILIIVLLVSFIAYDKVIKNDNNKSESVSEKENNSSTNNDEVISNEEAITIGNELYEKIHYIYWNTDVLSDSGSSITGEDGGIYYKFDYESEVKKYISSNFETKVKEEILIIEKEDGYYVQDLGRGSNQFYCDSSLAIDSIDVNKIVFKATASYDNVGWGPEKSECSNHIDYTKT